MLRGLLRFLAYSLAFWFIYRVIVGAFRRISQENRDAAAEPRAPRDPKPESTPDYRDVKEARFKDLPSDSSKSS